MIHFLTWPVWRYMFQHELSLTSCLVFLMNISFSRVPWFQYPIIYDIRARPTNISSPTGSKGECHLMDATLFVLTCNSLIFWVNQSTPVALSFWGPSSLWRAGGQFSSFLCNSQYLSAMIATVHSGLPMNCCKHYWQILCKNQSNLMDGVNNETASSDSLTLELCFVVNIVDEFEMDRSSQVQSLHHAQMWLLYVLLFCSWFSLPCCIVPFVLLDCCMRSSLLNSVLCSHP